MFGVLVRLVGWPAHMSILKQAFWHWHSRAWASSSSNGFYSCSGNF